VAKRGRPNARQDTGRSGGAGRSCRMRAGEATTGNRRSRTAPLSDERSPLRYRCCPPNVPNGTRIRTAMRSRRRAAPANRRRCARVRRALQLPRDRSQRGNEPAVGPLLRAHGRSIPCTRALLEARGCSPRQGRPGPSHRRPASRPAARGVGCQAGPGSRRNVGRLLCPRRPHRRR